MDHLNKLVKHDLVFGLPKIKFIKDKLCDACQKGKQTKVSFEPKHIVSTFRPLELIHMDLFHPSRNRILEETIMPWLLLMIILDILALPLLQINMIILKPLRNLQT